MDNCEKTKRLMARIKNILTIWSYHEPIAEAIEDELNKIDRKKSRESMKM